MINNLATQLRKKPLLGLVEKIPGVRIGAMAAQVIDASNENYDVQSGCTSGNLLRIYDPVLGRFLSADPVLPDASDMQQFNRYSYVVNNGLKYTDPTGNSYQDVSNQSNGCSYGSGCLRSDSGSSAGTYQYVPGVSRDNVGYGYAGVAGGGATGDGDVNYEYVNHLGATESVEGTTEFTVDDANATLNTLMEIDEIKNILEEHGPVTISVSEDPDGSSILDSHINIDPRDIGRDYETELPEDTENMTQEEFENFPQTHPFSAERIITHEIVHHGNPIVGIRDSILSASNRGFEDRIIEQTNRIMSTHFNEPPRNPNDHSGY